MISQIFNSRDISSVCYTATVSWESSQIATVNVSFAAIPQMAAQSYDLRFIFPSTFSMGPQPYRAPFGTVICNPSIIVNSSRILDCTSRDSPTFFAVFAIDTQGILPTSVMAMEIINRNSATTTQGTLSQWCPPVAIVSPTQATPSGGVSNTPNGYLNMPGIGPQPPWVVTLIFAAIGLILGGALFCYARHRAQARRLSEQNGEAGEVDRFQSNTANNSANTSPKNSDGNLTLIQKVQAAKEAKEIRERREQLHNSQ
ncbi:hypothetical protein HK100_005222 [Physocladia obscura]|uniref:Uncharacterized protein n=1 Tax=Physocladia obscura TaxID=109957 RepID=A0AAD5SUE2_9FUNG|nr:hypothetical protein HK100_005222 [Physocladia obscura]